MAQQKHFSDLFLGCLALRRHRRCYPITGTDRGGEGAKWNGTVVVGGKDAMSERRIYGEGDWCCVVICWMYMNVCLRNANAHVMFVLFPALHVPYILCY